MKIEFEKIKMEKIDKKLKVLDYFLDSYEWEVFTFRGDYILYDLQYCEIVDYYRDKCALIDRICGRALDYEIEEHEWEDNKINVNTYKYISNLLFIYDIYIGNNEYMKSNENWYKSKVNWLLEMEVI